jgi:hypothetical protein
VVDVAVGTIVDDARLAVGAPTAVDVVVPLSSSAAPSVQPVNETTNATTTAIRPDVLRREGCCPSTRPVNEAPPSPDHDGR